MIQAITCGLVLTSGAGMSLWGPMMTLMLVAKRRVRPSSSRCDSCLGSTATPPLPPPKGMPTTAHFQVIHMASARTSLRVTSWW